MKVMLFLGSGTSYASGMPSVSQITSELLEGDWMRHTEGVYLRGSYPGPDPCGFYATTVEQGAIRIIAKEIQDVFNKHDIGRKASYEDIYYVLTMLCESACGDPDPIVAPYRARVEELLQRAQLPGMGDYTTNVLFGRCISLVSCALIENLETPQTISGLEVLLDIAGDSKISELLVVTTNHDLLLETLLESNGVAYLDGFREEGAARREFAASNLEGKCRVKILKLHGSIDWHQVNGTCMKMRNPKPSELNKLEPGPVILCGSGNKPRSYSYNIFQCIHYHWQKHLDACDLMIMSGYGLNDQGINIRIEDWMRKRKSTLVLLHQEPEVLFKESSSMFVATYKEWLEKKKLVAVREWMESTRWGDLKKNIAEHL